MSCKKGSVGYWRGKKHSQKTKDKISESHTGKPLSKYHKIKISNSQKGEKGYNWKGGITSIRERIRKSSRYKDWRQQIFIRDNFTCQKCGRKGVNLKAHHKKPFSKLLQEVRKYLPLFDLYEGAMIYTPMWDTNNGKTLCEKCHLKLIRKQPQG